MTNAQKNIENHAKKESGKMEKKGFWKNVKTSFVASTPGILMSMGQDVYHYIEQ